MKTIAIAGVGLIGGSFGLAVRKAGFDGTILGVSSPRTVDKAIAAGAIDRGVSLEQAAAEADLLYLAQPIHGILAAIEQLSRYDRAGLFVTDAGSTKAAVVAQAVRYLRRCEFLGGHPMAGSTARGVEAASADLFRNRTYVLTPTTEPAMDTPAAGAFTTLLNSLGAHLLVLPPERHDQVVAFTSHLAQLASTALAVVLGENIGQGDLRAVGPGMRDMTRLALSSFEIWSDILVTNATEISHALDVYIDKLTKIRKNLQTPQLGVEFEAAAAMGEAVRRSVQDHNNQ